MNRVDGGSRRAAVSGGDRSELAGQAEPVEPAQLGEHLGDPARRDEGLLEPRGVALGVVVGGAVARVLVVVDYLQLINGRSELSDRANREEAVSEVGRRLVEFAEAEKVAMLALCQTNGEGEIRESRAVLQHAHNWWALHASKPKNGGDDGEPISAHIEIRKQRHGAWPVQAPMWFHPKNVLFSDEDT